MPRISDYMDYIFCASIKFASIFFIRFSFSWSSARISPFSKTLWTCFMLNQVRCMRRMCWIDEKNRNSREFVFKTDSCEHEPNQQWLCIRFVCTAYTNRTVHSFCFTFFHPSPSLSSTSVWENRKQTKKNPTKTNYIDDSFLYGQLVLEMRNVNNIRFTVQSNWWSYCWFSFRLSIAFYFFSIWHDTDNKRNEKHCEYKKNPIHSDMISDLRLNHHYFTPE